ncbi:MAG: hypothetical protein KDD64_16530, partial [Bdellovibrionales bacterium]|nr:hypothetical protein [Bdellovibrionales bacterium]
TQNLLDYLCFVHTVVICTPSNRSESFAQVTGLSGTDALGLCSFLLTLVQKPNDSAQKEEIIELRLSA